MKKGYVYVIIIIVALFMLVENHLDESLGDLLFQSLGISPWTGGGNVGLHLPVVVGVVLFIIGYVGTIRYYESRFQKIGRTILISSFTFFILYPVLTENLTWFYKYVTNTM